MIDQLIALAWILLKIMLILLPLIVAVAYTTMAERKVISYMQGRIGPNRVGIFGLGQPIADSLKLILKELIIPKASSRYLFLLAPVLSITPALAVWAVIPFAQGWVISNINAGLLLILSLTSIGVYGILVAGWASNSKYSLFGSLRSAAQVISYEIAMGFCFVGVLLAAGSANLETVVMHQNGGIWHWYCLPLLPLFIVYWISGVAETNRAPFDVAEGESEIVAGFHVEYSAMGFGVFFLAEYANMILIGAIASLLFLGGWLSPLQGIPFLEDWFNWVPGIFWFLMKTSIFVFVYFWLRATLPRYRYDQLMYLGWKVLIPVTLVWIVLEAIAVQFKLMPWFS